jgi:hypothetical protein
MWVTFLICQMWPSESESCDSLSCAHDHDRWAGSTPCTCGHGEGRARHHDDFYHSHQPLIVENPVLLDILWGRSACRCRPHGAFAVRRPSLTVSASPFFFTNIMLFVSYYSFCFLFTNEITSKNKWTVIRSRKQVIHYRGYIICPCIPDGGKGV